MPTTKKKPTVRAKEMKVWPVSEKLLARFEKLNNPKLTEMERERLRGSKAFGPTPPTVKTLQVVLDLMRRKTKVRESYLVDRATGKRIEKGDPGYAAAKAAEVRRRRAYHAELRRRIRARKEAARRSR